jgi:hypothetical protein
MLKALQIAITCDLDSDLFPYINTCGIQVQVSRPDGGFTLEITEDCMQPCYRDIPNIHFYHQVDLIKPASELHFASKAHFDFKLSPLILLCLCPSVCTCTSGLDKLCLCRSL